jgi:hypothetical protein
MKSRTDTKTESKEKEKLELIGAGVSANIEDLTFDNDTFGITLSIYLDVPIGKLEEIGGCIRRMQGGDRGEEETSEEMYRRMYEKEWKITIEEAEDSQK